MAKYIGMILFLWYVGVIATSSANYYLFSHDKNHCQLKFFSMLKMLKNSICA